MFTDHFSGATRNRPALEDLRRYVREGDTVVVHSVDRLARNLDDLRSLVREFTEAGVAVEFVKEHMTFTGADSPMQQLMLSCWAQWPSSSGPWAASGSARASSWPRSAVSIRAAAPP